MVEFFAELGVWDWFIVGGVLLILEVVAPGVFMLWLGLAAILVGAISLFVQLVLAGAIAGLRDVRRGRDPAVAPARQTRAEANRPAVPQSPRRCLDRPAIYAGPADRGRCRPDRRLRYRMAGCAGRTCRRAAGCGSRGSTARCCMSNQPSRDGDAQDGLSPSPNPASMVSRAQAPPRNSRFNGSLRTRRWEIP